MMNNTVTAEEIKGWPVAAMVQYRIYREGAPVANSRALAIENLRSGRLALALGGSIQVCSTKTGDEWVDVVAGPAAR